MLKHEHEAARRNKGTDVCSEQEQEGNPEEDQLINRMFRRRRSEEEQRNGCSFGRTWRT
jgi:hypothetical protein